MKKSPALFLCILFINLIWPAFSSENKKINSLEDLNKEGIKIGVNISTPAELLVPEHFPLAETVVYSDLTTGILSLQQDKIDAYADVKTTLDFIIDSGFTDGRILPGTFGEPVQIALGISDKTEIPDLEEKINAFITEKKEDGTLDRMYEHWVIKKEDTMEDIPEPENPGIELRVGTTGLIVPFSYYKGTELTGYDIELTKRLALYLNAKIELIPFDWGGLITAASTGIVDCVISDLFITEERKEVLTFSIPYINENTMVLVHEEENLLDGSELISSFEKTFVKESRWKLIVKGMGVTIFISILSALFGTIIGFALCALRLSKKKILDKSALVFIRIMQGMPMVVLLMILFYIVFAKAEIPGIWVAIIGFSINFAAYVCEIIRSGILAVDKGQMEAALALGYTKTQSFLKIVLPQAAKHFLPVYQGEFISLVKMTSVVGYIAIQDLTKASDIIRSRTYEAIFPLITTAVIYFVITWVFTRILVFTQKKLDPRSRKVREA